MPDGTSSSLSQVKISELPVAPSINDADQLEANQAGTSRSITVGQVKAAVPLPPLGVPAERFGAVGNGVHDDTAALQAGIDFLFARGGGVLALTGRYLVDSANLVVKDRVFLQGTLENFGVPTWLAPFDYSGIQSCLVINSAYTIQAYGRGGGLRGLAILRKGLTVPTDVASASALKLSFAGTAITLGDGTASGKGADYYLGHLFIAGFNYGIYTDYADRYRIEYICGHNWMEIYSVHTYDMGHINNCHFWPFLLAGQSWTMTNNLWRTYRGLFLDQGTDGTVVADVFTFGKDIGFENTADIVSYIGCWCDGSATGAFAGTCGFKISWPAKTTRLIGCSVSQQDNGVVIDTHSTPYAGDTMFITNGNFFDNITNAVLVTNGQVVVSGTALATSTNGLNVQSGRAVMYSGCIFDNCTNPVVFPSPATSLLRQSSKNLFVRCTDPVGNNLVGQTTFTGPDSPTSVRIAGATNGIRFGTDSTGSHIDGVDSTGTGSFQPLFISGSAVNITAPVSTTGSVRTNYQTAIAAGSASQSLIMGSGVANFGIFYGSGAPTFAAAANSIYMRSDGNSTTTRMYVNTTGSTTWATVTTSA